MMGMKGSWETKDNQKIMMMPNNASSTNIIPMMRSKDSVNHFLKTATVKQLTSIEEKSLGQSSSDGDASSINDDGKDVEKAKETLGQQYAPFEHSKTSPLTTPGTGKIYGGSIKLQTKPKRNHKRQSYGEAGSSRYPDLGFLENDVGLWDAFFLHGKNSRSHRYVANHI